MSSPVIASGVTADHDKQIDSLAARVEVLNDKDHNGTLTVAEYAESQRIQLQLVELVRQRQALKSLYFQQPVNMSNPPTANLGTRWWKDIKLGDRILVLSTRNGWIPLGYWYPAVVARLTYLPPTDGRYTFVSLKEVNGICMDLVLPGDLDSIAPLGSHATNSYEQLVMRYESVVKEAMLPASQGGSK